MQKCQLYFCSELSELCQELVCTAQLCAAVHNSLGAEGTSCNNMFIINSNWMKKNRNFNNNRVCFLYFVI